MNFTKEYIKDEITFLSSITSLIVDESNTLSIICAGHFLLIPDESKKKLIPAIFNSIDSDSFFSFAKQMVGIFPQYTFEVAAKALSANKGSKAKSLISVLVNDWQLVPEDKHRVSLSEPNTFRKSFYESFKELPEEYSHILIENGLNIDDVIYKTDTGEFYLKEVSLRDRFMRKAKSLFKQKEANYVPVGMCSLELDDCGNINMINDDEIAQKLSDNSRAGCAAGVAQMMIDIFNQNRDGFNNITFINLMPWGCVTPVNAASELALNFIEDNTKQTQITISNYYLDGSNTKKPEDFYNNKNRNGIVNYTFKNY